MKSSEEPIPVPLFSVVDPIVMSLVQESEWVRTFQALPVFDVPDKPLLVIAPHPDDETLGAGGLIAAQRQRGLEIVVVAVTDGENAYTDAPGLAAIRQVEQTNALECLGVPSRQIIRFGLPDSNVSSRHDELVGRLTSLISADTHVIAPWSGDFHPDHEACGRAAEMIAHRTGATLTSYFFWTWHFGSLTSLKNLRLRSFSLDPELLRLKSEALLYHRSQLSRPNGEPVLPYSLLAPARRPFEIFAIA